MNGKSNCSLSLSSGACRRRSFATSSRHADLSWAHRFAVASPRFIGRRSASTVLSQDCLGRPALRLQSPGESIMQASRARWWSCQGSARRRCPKNDRREGRLNCLNGWLVIYRDGLPRPESSPCYTLLFLPGTNRARRKAPICWSDTTC